MTKRRTMFDELPPKLQEIWRANSAKGGRGARGKVKAAASRIGWARSPNRFDKRRQQRMARKEAPMPTGFFCSGCGKWHEYPKNFDFRKRQYHVCSCKREHSILRGVAKPLK